MRATDRMGLAVTVSVLLASLTLAPLTRDSTFLGVAWLLVLLLGGLSAVLRRVQLGAAAVLGLQLAVAGLYVAMLGGRLSGDGSGWLNQLGGLGAAGVEHMRVSAAPMPSNDGVTLIFVAIVGVIAILTDLLAVGIARPAWALGPPATLFGVPAVGLSTDTGVLSFACVALGYLAILLAEGLNSTARWTRGLSRDSAGGAGTASGVVWRAGGYLAAPAVIIAIVLSLALPTLALPGWGFGGGSGRNGPLQLTDPTLDLRRNLTQPVDTKVIEYESNSPGGSYLRMASLPQFNASGWSNVQMQLDEGTRLSPIPGVSGDPTNRRTSRITVLDLQSEYLPLPYATRSFTAEGEWAYDPTSLVVLSMARGNRENAIRNLSYTVESVDIAPEVRELAAAAAGTPADAVTTAAVPRDLPDELIDLTREVTKDANTPALKAAAIQAFLRSGEFTYSTRPLPGSGYQALSNFLLRDREGYCEQFAAAMAMMARISDIPSRVAIGFLPGERSGNSYTVTIRDMHAWPELYFAGHGWVRFEPTPASVTGTAPDWTVRDNTDPADDPTEAPSASASASAPVPSEAPSLAPDDPGAEAGAGGASVLRTVGLTALGLLALVVLAAPATLRIRRRAARLAPGQLTAEQVEAAWAEIRDTVWDYGGSWPEGSPKVIGGTVGERLEPSESAAMSTMATLVERTRYAAVPPDELATRDVPSLTREIRQGLSEPQSWWRKAAAVVVPASLLRPSRLRRAVSARVKPGQRA